MSDSAYVVEVTRENFVQTIIEASQSAPVLVDFWADWCSPCKVLMPILSALAEEYDGAFTLAKVNTEELPELAQQAGVRNLPTVMLFRDGQPVDAFTGALPESQIREFLTKNDIHSSVDQRLPQAKALAERGDLEGAIALLNSLVAEDSSNGEALLALAQIAIQKGENDTAEALIQQIPDDFEDKVEVDRLKGMITFSQLVDKERNLTELTEAMQSGNADSATQYQYAIHSAIVGDFELALQTLLKLMQTDRAYDDGAPAKGLITIFDVLGSGPLVAKYRRQMFNLLH